MFGGPCYTSRLARGGEGRTEVRLHARAGNEARRVLFHPAAPAAETSRDHPGQAECSESSWRAVTISQTAITAAAWSRLSPCPMT